MKKGIFIKIMEFRLVLVLFILNLIGAGFTIWFYLFSYFILGPMMAVLTTLLSNAIILFLPLTMKKINQDEEKEKNVKFRKKGYNAFKELCDYYFSQIDEEKGIPKEEINETERSKMISQVQTIYTYRDILFSIGIIISSGWKDIKEDYNIYIHTNEELDFNISAYDFGKIKKIELKNHGNLIKDRKEVLQILEEIEQKVETVDIFVSIN